MFYGFTQLLQAGAVCPRFAVMVDQLTVPLLEYESACTGCCEGELQLAIVLTLL
jgi:hypothetical protein